MNGNVYLMFDFKKCYFFWDVFYVENDDRIIFKIILI